MAYVNADILKENFIKMLNCFDGTTVLLSEIAISIGRVIEEAPTADVEEVRHGEWLPQIVSGVKAWDCSECKTLGSPHWKRCPICEAKMDGGKTK